MRFMTSADCNTFFSEWIHVFSKSEKLIVNEFFPFNQWKPKFRVPIDSAPRLSHVVAFIAAIFIASAPSRRLCRASSVAPSSSRQLHRAVFVMPSPSRHLCRAISVGVVFVASSQWRCLRFPVSVAPSLS